MKAVDEYDPEGKHVKKDKKQNKKKGKKKKKDNEAPEEVSAYRATLDKFCSDHKIFFQRTMRGGAYNGNDLKKIFRRDRLEKLASMLSVLDADLAKAVTDYMDAIRALHALCVSKHLVPFDFNRIILRFESTFKAVYNLKGKDGRRNPLQIHHDDRPHPIQC